MTLLLSPIAITSDVFPVSAFFFCSYSLFTPGGSFSPCCGTGVFIATSLRRRAASSAPVLKYSLAGGALRLEFERLRPVAEVVAVPRRLRLERRQAEPLPERRAFSMNSRFGSATGAIGALERRVDQHGRGLAAIARAARPVSRMLVTEHLEIVLWLAAVAHRPEQRVGILRIDVLVDGDDPLAGVAVQQAAP